MGKRKRLNRFISKWIKSDLPDDCSTVLLLGVTRIPTTPTPVRRPTSLALNTNQKFVPQTTTPSQHKIHKKSSITKSGLLRHNSINKHESFKLNNLFNSPKSTTPADVNNSISNNESSSSDDVTPSNETSLTVSPGTTTMDRSVDSIGACSLDVEASVDMTDWSEETSVGTLRSASLSTPEPQPHLPSYLSLACTVSGYSTTTNYDRDRLSKSRDASPHRPNDDLNFYNPQIKNNCTYSVRNNLLSPPNLVPLPNLTLETRHNGTGMEKQILTRQEFYSTKSTSGSSFISTENRTTVYSRDAVDGCITDNRMQSKCVSYEKKSQTHIENGLHKTLDSSHIKEYSNGSMEQKSFIQQRVERLYGPGALAQGFFISKRQLNNSLDDSDSKINVKIDRLNKTPIKLLDSDSCSDSSLKQSASSPTLPVMRHLRPEFRAQLLPIISPKRNCENGALPKSSTTPTLSEKQNVNGHSQDREYPIEAKVNGSRAQENLVEREGVKDGHHFIKILERETKRLLLMAEKIEGEMETHGLTEEIVGKLRSAAGKARLLASQKMQQFKGLCAKNIAQIPGEPFPTTNADLEGFWDMVMLQVDQINALFKEIDVIRENGWKELKAEVPEKVATKQRRATSRPRPPSAGNEAARKKREAERKQLIEEKRKAAREQNKQSNSIQIYVPDSS